MSTSADKSQAYRVGGETNGPAAWCRRDEDVPRIEAALTLARQCRYERGHTHQVTRLALTLFDQLQDLHQMGDEERFWLHCAGLLHDIGWLERQKGHHKTALRLILDASDLLLDQREQRLVAAIARYHRKALPRENHAHFAALATADRQRVRVLAGILRVADGLDRSHLDLVHDLACDISQRKIVVQCKVPTAAESEVWAASRKGDLLETVLGRKLVIQMNISDEE